MFISIVSDKTNEIANSYPNSTDEFSDDYESNILTSDTSDKDSAFYTCVDESSANDSFDDSEKDTNDFKPRARQNVVFEHGYLVAKLTRERVCAFVKGNVETPGDISGVIYTTMDAHGAWRQSLVKNMKAVGLEADSNKLL